MNHLDTGERGLWCCWVAIPILLAIGIAIAVLIYRASIL